MVLSEKYLFNLLKDYFNKYGPWHKQIKSFEQFILDIQKIIDEESTIEVPIDNELTYLTVFGNCYLNKPTIIEENRVIRYPFPCEARIRELHYRGSLTVDIDTYILKKLPDNKKQILQHKKYLRQEIAKIPIMVGSSKCNLYGKNERERIKSGECANDKGGYFLINGKERVSLDFSQLSSFFIDL